MGGSNKRKDEMIRCSRSFILPSRSYMVLESPDDATSPGSMFTGNAHEGLVGDPSFGVNFGA